ncbi:MAG: hypothetical protein KF751_07955 [Nitrospira sp.]|nr:hypothetical protein [Nitrospira sp.]
MALSTVALDPNIVAIAAAMRVIIVEDMAKIPWPSRRPAMISVRKIVEPTGEKIVVLIAVRIGARIARWIDEKIAVRTDKPIGERIIGPMQAGNSVDLIERIMWPGDMVVKAEKMPG